MDAWEVLGAWEAMERLERMKRKAHSEYMKPSDKASARCGRGSKCTRVLSGHSADAGSAERLTLPWLGHVHGMDHFNNYSELGWLCGGNISRGESTCSLHELGCRCRRSYCPSFAALMRLRIEVQPRMAAATGFAHVQVFRITGL